MLANAGSHTETSASLGLDESRSECGVASREIGAVVLGACITSFPSRQHQVEISSPFARRSTHQLQVARREHHDGNEPSRRSIFRLDIVKHDFLASVAFSKPTDMSCASGSYSLLRMNPRIER